MAQAKTAGRQRPWHPTRLRDALHKASAEVDTSDMGTENCVTQLRRRLVLGMDIHVEDEWRQLFTLVREASRNTNVKFVARLTDDIEALGRDVRARIDGLAELARARARVELAYDHGRLEALRRLLTVVLLDLEVDDRSRRVVSVLRQAGYWDLIVDMHANGGRTAHAIANGRSAMRTREVMDVLTEFDVMTCRRSTIDVPETWQDDFYEIGDVGRALIRLDAQDLDHSAG